MTNEKTERTIDYRLPSSRMKDAMGGGGIREILTKAEALEREGRKIIHLEIGRPDYDSRLREGGGDRGAPERERPLHGDSRRTGTAAGDSGRGAELRPRR